MAFPVEIWRECWRHNGPKELGNLSLVSKTFQTVCQPLLFRKITFWAPFPEDISKRNCRKWVSTLLHFAEMLLNLQRNPRLAAYVYEFGFNGSNELDLMWKYPGFEPIQLLESSYRQVVKSFKSTLPSLLHLRRLVLYEIRVTARDLQVISQLPYLNTIKTFGVEFVARSCQTPVKLQKFTIEDSFRETDGVHPRTLVVVSPEKLEQLTLGSKAYNIACLSSLIDHGGCPMLTKFTVRVQSSSIVELLFAFFIICPQLQELIVELGFGFDNATLTFPSLPATALPLLRSYDGPPGMAAILAPGRPVEYMRLYLSAIDDYNWTTEENFTEAKSILARLTQASIPIKDLAIAITSKPEIFPVIHVLYPNLRQLSVDVIDNSKGSDQGDNDTDEDDEEDDEDDDDEENDEDSDEAQEDDEDNESSHEGDSDSDDSTTSGLSRGKQTRFMDLLISGVQLVEDGIADIAVKDDGTPVRSLDTFTGVMDALALNLLPLPPKIEILSVRRDFVSSYQGHEKFSLPQQRRFITEICRIYPSLWKVTMGENCYHWIKESTEWKVPNVILPPPGW
ncbi:hypothetical protein M422DRAFT_777517 [Sphaerobolus stellatus SS14]|nr:hypothetical protein M422DRAFT_777517 [Sphaerobolus stellatus SS14]